MLKKIGFLIIIIVVLTSSFGILKLLAKVSTNEPTDSNVDEYEIILSEDELIF